jgi:hypothetical protein
MDIDNPPLDNGDLEGGNQNIRLTHIKDSQKLKNN